MPELSNSSDPKALVPGTPEHIRDVARTMRGYGTTLISIGEGFRKLDTGVWKGPAADKYRDHSEQQPKRWIDSGDAFHKAAISLYAHAETLGWGQNQAKEAVRLYQEAEQLTQAAKQAQIGYLSGTVVFGFMDPLDDPGAEKRAAALDMLDNARAQIEEVGKTTARQVREAAELAPQKPWWDAISDRWNSFWGGVGQSVNDSWDTVTYLATAHPDDVGRTVASSFSSAAANPGGFIGSQLELDTARYDPDRAAGLLLPSLLTRRGKAPRLKGLAAGGEAASRVSKWADKIVRPTSEWRKGASKITPEAEHHIIVGDGPGQGGHAWKNFENFPEEYRKSYFPQEWNHEKIAEAVKQVAGSPDSIWVQETGPLGQAMTHAGDPATFKVFGSVDGVEIQVVVEPEGKGIHTAFPPGYTYNHP